MEKFKLKCLEKLDGKKVAYLFSGIQYTARDQLNAADILIGMIGDPVVAAREITGEFDAAFTP